MIFFGSGSKGACRPKKKIQKMLILVFGVNGNRTHTFYCTIFSFVAHFDAGLEIFL